MSVTASMLNIVRKTAEKSSMKFKLGCGIFEKNKVWATGHNIQLGECSIHAEMSAIEKLMRRMGLMNKFRKTLCFEGHPKGFLSLQA